MSKLNNDFKDGIRKDHTLTSVISNMNSKELRDIYSEIYKQNSSSIILFESPKHQRNCSEDDKIIHSPHLCRHI